MSIWRSLQRRMDGLVDTKFSEPVEIRPWTGGQHATDAGHADPARSVLRTLAVVVVPGAAATGEAGTISSGLGTQVVTGKEWLSITEDNLGDPAHWRQYDRVYLPERPLGQRWFTIESIPPAVTGRLNINLIRLQPDPGTP